MCLHVLDSSSTVIYGVFFFLPSSSGQTAGPASQQTSNPDYNAWVDFYRQPMAYFNQGAQQTQAPGLQVRTNCLNVYTALFTVQINQGKAGIFSFCQQIP